MSGEIDMVGIKPELSIFNFEKPSFHDKVINVRSTV